MGTKDKAIGKKQNVDLLPTPWDIEHFDFGEGHPRLLVAYQGLAWMQAYPSSTHYFGSTRTQLRNIIYEMTGFMLPRGKKVYLPLDTPDDILRWLYVNALRYLDTNLLEEAYAEQAS
jgi:hypothetical protein